MQLFRALKTKIILKPQYAAESMWIERKNGQISPLNGKKEYPWHIFSFQRKIS